MTARAIERIDRRTAKKRGRVLLAVLLAVAQLGCGHIGPSTIVDDRLHYNEAVAQSWNEQTLLNIVKMRYNDTVQFSEISQIVSTYRLDQVAGSDLGVVPGTTAGIAGEDRIRALLNLRVACTDRPTITYTPKIGSKYLKQLAQPLAPSLVLFLIESGYPADDVLTLTLDSINGVRNPTSTVGDAQAADPQFEWLVQVLRRMQLSRGISMRVEIDEQENATTIMVLRSAELDPALEDELRMAKELLKLDRDTGEFNVVAGASQFEPNELAVQTRPILRVLSALSQFVQVPRKHLADGSARPVSLSQSYGEPPFMVHCGAEPPEDCYLAVPYRGCWYWIDDRDLRSKRTLIFLHFLLAQAERGTDQTLPLVTIRAN